MESVTLNQLAGCAPAFASFSKTTARPLLRLRSIRGIMHAQSPEIQSQSTDLRSDEAHCSIPSVAMPAWEHACAPVADSRSTSLSAAGGEDAVHSIELQEQGHTEMLEHALGELVDLLEMPLS